MSTLSLRLSNGLRKVAAGLRPLSESVWPGVRNDLFVAHESIYRFFGAYVDRKDVLDAGSGTGYGSRLLVSAGARSVVGIDFDRLNVRYSARHYGGDAVTFIHGTIEDLAACAADTFDVITASNSLEHLERPESFLAQSRRVLRGDGIILVAVPPILSVADRVEHGRIHYHRSNLSVSEWHALFREAGFSVTCYSHRAKPGVAVDFSDRGSSVLASSDFDFVPTGLDGLLNIPSITAIFELRLAQP